ncbi:sugar phosphate isomerase/epimerase [Acidaminobacter sp. JC074]|uniref:sugar phosphate isomerase/epimerase family protein n=1 Tax=Acidaminobacter sp. JC074 TaxID=2530199 RepID=UPI001F106060|nr:sugar phosphate isomerase/epimerase [Acidaminobacter sp. JC074]MCH4887019.1 sugar phosphate isomerase/epimerase [Acidaminobacter sp. JC074]
MISAQLYTVRDLLMDKSEDDIESVLKEIADIGYKGVQLSGIGRMTDQLADTYHKICQKLSLEIVATHFSLDFIEENLDDLVKWHHLWSCRYTGVGAMPDHLRNEKGIHEFIVRMEILAKALKNHNLQLIYHNHKFEFEKSGQKTWMAILQDHFNYTEFELDTYWLQAGGVNPSKWIEKVRIDVIHLKDYKIKNDQVMFAEVGKGNLDFYEIISACKKKHIKHYIVEQDTSDDPLESLRISYDYLKNLI